MVPLLFGDNVSNGNDATFSDQITHFGKLQRSIDARFSGRNLTALVIASDGLYNKGPHPVSILKQLNIPVFTVGVGDTTLHRDLLISNVSANKIAYLGNDFPIRLNIEGRKALGKSTVVTVSKNGVQLASQSISFSSEREFKNIELGFISLNNSLILSKRVSLIILTSSIIRTSKLKRYSKRPTVR